MGTLDIGMLRWLKCFAAISNLGSLSMPPNFGARTNARTGVKVYCSPSPLGGSQDGKFNDSFPKLENWPSVTLKVKANFNSS